MKNHMAWANCIFLMALIIMALLPMAMLKARADSYFREDPFIRVK
jgi:hypothetical protein